ncbi:carbohydrate sulfotransferase 1-like [Saccoglossus kowalevskii]|uniref:Carbohydrate sulfotransferase 3-like n=1 Tax=Saccoglossus kowalevskii TaxID=10224 RepID=A0ABM0MCQ0_SACKO|nr:PREDICTED: carbohydrate sulfotransferase 3-like [Saccoglossus kowalevskii]
MAVAFLIVAIAPRLKYVSPMIQRLRGSESDLSRHRQLFKYPGRPLFHSFHDRQPYRAINPELELNHETWSDYLHDALDTDGDNSTNNTRVKVIILAKMRTGSSFLGELFNHHPDFFYLFEPFLVVNQMVRSGVLQKRKFTSEMIRLLGRLLNCDTSDYFVQYLNREKWMGLQQSNSISPGFTRKTFRELCNNQRHFSLKTIRVENIRDMWQYVRNASQNIKILHLVRDPRGMVHSRLKLKYLTNKRIYGMGGVMMDPQLIHTTRDTCQWMARNAQEGFNGPFWVRNNYKLVRYEDLAEKPFKTAKEIFNFMNIPIHPNVYEWIGKNTGEEPQTKDKHKYPYQTKRNSKATSQAWRSKLTAYAINAIENACGQRIMSMFGYKILKDSKNLGNKSFTFVSPSVPVLPDYASLLDVSRADQL